MLKGCIEETRSDPKAKILAPKEACECMLDYLLASEHVATTKNEDELYDLDFDEIGEEQPLLAERFEECILSTMDRNMPLNTMGADVKKVMVTECVNGAKEDPDIKKAKINPHAYCKCVFDEVWGRDLSITGLQDLQNPNSVEFNEIVLPCIKNSVGASTIGSTRKGKKKRSVRMTESADVKGPRLTERVPIIAVGKLHKVKMQIGGETDYYLIDSGASDCLISAEFAEELKKLGKLHPEQYLSDLEYTLADGRTVKCKRFVADYIGLGSFRINEVTFAVLDELDVTFILGKSLLDKFTTWTIEHQVSLLYLKK